MDHAHDQNIFQKLATSGMLMLFTVCFAALAAYAVFQGAAVFVEGVFHRGLMAGASFMLTAGLYLFLHSRFATADKKGRRMFLAALCLAIPFILAISTLSGAVFFGGDSAIRNKMNMVLETSSLNLQNTSEYIAREAGIGSLLDSLSLSFQAMAESEKRGGFSGSTGAGNVSATIQQASVTLTTMKKVMVERQKPVQQLRADAEQALSGMRAIVNSPNGHGHKASDFSAALSEFNAALTRLQAASVRTTIRNLAERLPESVVAVTSLSQNQQVATQQQAALTQVRTAIATAQDSLTRFITDLRGVSPKPVDMFSTGDIFESLFINISLSMVIAIAIAVAIDFTPLLFLFLEVVAFDGLRRKKEGTEDV